MNKTLKLNTATILLILFSAICFGQMPEPVEKGDIWYYKSAKGDTILKTQYQYAGTFSKYGIAPVIDSIGWAYINVKGEVLVRPFIFDNGPDYFSEGMARYVENGKFGFFDKRGNKLIAAEYDFALPFSEGKAVVSNGCTKEYHGEHYIYTGGTWGYINKTGEVIIPLKYEDATSFDDEKAKVKLGKWYYILPDGKVQD